MSALSFTEAVAARCGKSANDIDIILARNGIAADPSPPLARRLRVSRLYFAGTKNLHGESVPFSFDWPELQDGLWMVVSEDNLAGKSSTLQIVLWALRGKPKTLQADVRNWLSRVEVDFKVDGRDVRVRFDVTDGVANGSVVVDDSEGDRFSDEQSFVRVMQSVMLRLLGFEAVKASRSVGEDDAVAYEEGWLAYTGAFLSDEHSDAIIGQWHPGMTQRFLQVFLGIPWVTTLFQARAARAVLEAETAQRKRRLNSLGGRTVEEMRDELKSLETQISDEASRNRTVAKISTEQAALDTLHERVVTIRMRVSEFEGLLEECKAAKTRAERAVLDADEEARASVFFKQLNPVECPRCSTRIDESRRQREAVESACSVCATVIDNGGEVSAEARRAAAREHAKKAEQELKDAKRAVDSERAHLEKLIAERNEVAKRLSTLSKLGTAMDVQLLERRRERLEGMLEIATAVVGEIDDSNEGIDVVVAAESEARERVEESSKAIMEKVSDEVLRVVRLLGMTAADKVVIDRGARARVWKGGTQTNFSSLTDGEQLRIRVATLLALMRTARDYGRGRHPGFLVIDSPGNAEMKDENVEEVVRQLNALVADIKEVQILVGVRNVQLASTLVPPRQYRAAAEGASLW